MNRRTLLLAALGGAITACTAPPERTVRIAAGEPGGFFLAFSELLAKRIQQDEPNLRCTVVTTQGSVENIQRLRDGNADLALSLADVATSVAETPLRALGRVFENYTQFVVRASSPVRAVPDLAGRTIALGAPGSGAAYFGKRLTAAAGLQTRVEYLPLAEALAALESGRIDALLWSGGIPTPALSELDSRIGLRLLPLDHLLAPLRRDHGTVYHQVQIPAGTYGLNPPVPTIGIADLVVCTPALPGWLASAVVNVLVRDASALVPTQAVGTQFLDVRTLINTAGIPVHPGAAATYRQLHG